MTKQNEYIYESIYLHLHTLTFHNVHLSHGNNQSFAQQSYVCCQISITTDQSQGRFYSLFIGFSHKSSSISLYYLVMQYPND